jgi:signal transduction histidine kinase
VDREVATLTSAGRPVAVLLHAAGLLSRVEAALGPAVRLALDNERLRALGLAQVQELRESRESIVQVGDLERRRLERDLHDGAQQQLLAATFEVQLARMATDEGGDRTSTERLTAVLDRARTVLEELREIAHGIFPAILDEAGLAPALASLKDTASLRLDLEDVTGDRYASSTETTAYLGIAEAVDDAVWRGARAATVMVRRHGDHLAIEVRDDGAPRRSDVVRTADRIGAQGGRVQVGPTTLQVELPCA